MMVMGNRFLAVVAVLTAGLVQAQAAVKVDVNWEHFLARHDLVWTEAPQAWHDGPFLGNGMLGSMIHQVDDHTLRFSLGRADMEDHQPEGTTAFIRQARLPNGFFTLKTVGKITGFEGRLDLYNAETRVQVKTEQGTIDLLGLVHSQDMVVFYDLLPSNGEKAFQLDFVPLKAMAPARLQSELAVKQQGDRAPSSRISWAKAPYQYNPEPTLTEIDGFSVSKQPLTCGGENGTAWVVKERSNGGKQLFVSIEHSYPEAAATSDAIAHLKAIEKEPLDQFVARHRTWWHDYYPKSFISVDDTRMESFYWIQVYKFGAGARKGRAFMDTMGPWIVENTAWSNGWFNLNTQLSYWFLSTANRMEVAESLFTKLDEKLPQLMKNMPAACEDCAGMGSIAPQTFVSPVSRINSSFTGELLWTCHDYWLMLERNMDAERTTEKFFPLLKKAVNAYLHFMEEGDDGKIHLPRTKSPEYGSGVDCNFNLALFRWGLATLIDLDERYGLNDPLLSKWQDTHTRLADYPVNENGYMVAKNFPFRKSHRHYSHLMMIYPLIEVNWDQPESRELIKKSVDHWINYPGSGNAGYSFSAAAAMYALMANGDEAASYLNTFLHMQQLLPGGPGRIWCTTMYTETSRVQPVTETPLSLCDSMQLMLLQSWGDKVRVFPAVPEDWKNIAFDGLLAKGGFTVSAKRADGGTQFVQVKSNAGEPCRLQTDIKFARIEGVPESAVKREGQGLYTIDLKQGQTVTFIAEGVDEMAIGPVEARQEDYNTFGLNERYNK